jgi:peptidoglycan/xylan/chitin deacetylase (PgdA/CDA1 family)
MTYDRIRKHIITQYSVKLGRRALRAVTRGVMGSITHVVTTEPIAALTFDDGPHPDYTPRLLEILERHQARGTFFMLGKVARQYPELLQRMAQAGHVIGNHSWDHALLPRLTAYERRQQVRACTKALAPYGERLFRPPYCEQSVASRFDLLCLRHKVVMFSCEAGDWWDPDAPRMAESLVKRVQPGSIILLHDAIRPHPSPKMRPQTDRSPHFDREAMLETVDMFLTRVGQRFRFVTIPELLRNGRPQRKSWYQVTPPEVS